MDKFAKRFFALFCLFLCAILLSACALLPIFTPTPVPTLVPIDGIPAYNGEPYVTLNGGVPDFTEADMALAPFESYSPLDSLGRCGPAFACISRELMPTEPRESIYSVKPTGWHSVTYDCVDQGSLYNRCHLIAFQLTGENANAFNLITGTRYFNAVGMQPFEERVGAYIRSTGHRVLYRVTPVFEGNELVCRGVRIEAASVEDAAIRIHVFVYNVQPLIAIDYATGASYQLTPSGEEAIVEYVLNTGNKKFHLPSCESCQKISESNRGHYRGTRSALLQQGYTPCGACRP